MRDAAEISFSPPGFGRRHLLRHKQEFLSLGYCSSTQEERTSLEKLRKATAFMAIDVIQHENENLPPPYGDQYDRTRSLSRYGVHRTCEDFVTSAALVVPDVGRQQLVLTYHILSDKSWVCIFDSKDSNPRFLGKYVWQMYSRHWQS